VRVGESDAFVSGSNYAVAAFGEPRAVAFHVGCVRRMRARASRMQKGASLLQKEGFSHALRNPLAFTSRRFRMQK